jgi:preprotein translocase subunit SecF
METVETGLESLSNRIKEGLEKKFGGSNTVEIQRVEMVGPKAGKELTNKALYAVFFSILCMGVYISGRFEMNWVYSGALAAGIGLVSYLLEGFIGTSFMVLVALFLTLGSWTMLRYRFALGAMVALVHDVLITAGALSVTHKEFSLTIVAALLTIVGYSVNDTIVVFDRIRENSKKSTRGKFADLINASINETLSRTILTVVTVIIVLVVLYIFGGPVIHDFAFTLIVGLMIGTYSSIFIASPIVLFLEEKKAAPARRTRR